jgi:hypothetical protein
MHRHRIFWAFPPLMLALGAAVSCTTSEPIGAGGASPPIGAAGTTGAAGSPGTAGGSNAGAAGTTGAAGSTVGNAGTTGADGSTAGTTGAAGNSTGTAGSTDASAGTDGGAADTPVASLSFMTDVAPIVMSKCSPCHTTQAKAGFNWNYMNLVTNPTVTATTTVNCSFMMGSKKHVVPGMPNTSLMWIKLSRTSAELTTAKCGLPMPQSPQTLTSVEKTTIQDWIMGGAKP